VNPDNKNMSEADKWQRRFHISENAQQPLFRKVEKFYDILYAVFNTSSIAPWRSKVYVPTLASKAWDLIARLSTIQPEFTVDIENELEEDPQNPDQLQYTKSALERMDKINDKLEDDFENTPGEPMKLKLFNTLVDAVVAGTGYANICWSTSKKQTKARPVDENNMTDLGEEIVKEGTNAQNDFEPVNFFNVFNEPNIPSFYDGYTIVRLYTTKQKAKDSGLYDNKLIDTLIESKPSNNNFTTFNQARDRALSNKNENDETVDTICLYQCYEDDGTCKVYGEGPDTGKSSNAQNDTPGGWVDVKAVTDQYWHGMKPLVPFYIRKRSFSAFGESLFENNARLNMAVNDLFNHYLDNWNLSIDSMLIYEDNSLQNDFVVEPGGEIVYTGTEPKQFKFPEPDPQQLSVVMGVLNQAIEAATVPQYLSGVPDSALDKTQGTATGVKNITEAATEKVAFMRDNYKQSMKLVGKMWLSNLQQFMDAPAQLKTVNKGKITPKILMPGDLQGEMDVDIDDDSMIPVTKEQKRQSFIDMVGQLIGLQKAAVEQVAVYKDPTDVPRYDFVELSEDLADLFAVKDSQKYFKTDGQAPPPQQQQPSEKIIENLSAGDLTKAGALDTVQSLIQQAGLPPSKLLEIQIEADMATHGQTINQATAPGQPQQPQPAGVPNGQ
jgi:hypothetical protein